MISQKQLELADYIKGVHLSLRRRSQQIGAEKAWDEHLQNEKVLKNYADCMKNLARDYWAQKNDSKNLCRIKWMVDVVEDYFGNDGFKKQITKEKEKMEKFCKKDLTSKEELIQYGDLTKFVFEKPYKLLDVGSCYNPFNTFEIFKTYAVDLYPASADVKKCNFLEVSVDEWKSNWFLNVQSLPCNYFDVVVFSLFLEYLPLPQQRYLSCKKAYDCLKTGGLLLIATPDSKHASAHSQLMKSWKIALSTIGFIRLKIEKLKYIYCMAFQKSLNKNYPALTYNIKMSDISEPSEMIVIPQDFVDYQIKDSVSNIKINENENENDTKEGFEQLPFCFE